jgi:hypothetical protein
MRGLDPRDPKGYIEMTEENTDVVENEEVVEETDLQKAVKIVEIGMKHELSEDDIKINLVRNGGFGFRKAGKMFDLACQDLGLQLSSSDRYELVSAMFEGIELELNEWADVIATADHIAEEVDMTSQKQALVALKKYAKEFDIALPEKPKREKGESRGASGFRTKAFAWMVDNTDATEKDLVKFCTDNDRMKEQLHKNLSRIFALCKKFHAAASE